MEKIKDYTIILKEVEETVKKTVTEKITKSMESKTVEELKVLQTTVDYREYKDLVKGELEKIALNKLDISTTDYDKRNVRETYMYRDFLDEIYSIYSNPDFKEISVYQDLIMEALNEIRGGCTRSLARETEDTVTKIKECMTKIDEFNKKIAKEEENGKTGTAKSFTKLKEAYIKEFDDKMEKRERQPVGNVKERPSEAQRPMNKVPKNRRASDEITRTITEKIVSILEHEKEVAIKEERKEKKTIYKVVEKEVPGPKVVVVKEVKVPVPGPEKVVEVPGPERIVEKIVEKEKEPKVKIKFEGKKGVYVLDFADEIKQNGLEPITFKPRLLGNFIKKFNNTIAIQECKERGVNLRDFKYDPAKVIDPNIYVMLKKYGMANKEVGNKLKDYYIDEVVRFCKKDKDEEDKEKGELDINYDLRDFKSKASQRSLGTGISGFVRRYRVKKYAEVSGPEGIRIAEYTRPKQVKRGLVRDINSRRGNITQKVKDKFNDMKPRKLVLSSKPREAYDEGR